MKFRRILSAILPDGQSVLLLPFHISLEGMERAILCRDNQDYDAMVKYFALAGAKHNVLIVTYAVVSNHAHCVVLAENEALARAFGYDLKKRYSQWLRKQYGENKVLHHTAVDVQLLDTDWYVRNAIAYDIRNALDNGATSVSSYKWTSFRSMFCSGAIPSGCRKVSSLTCREKDSVMHTRDACKGLPWQVNSENELEPASFCYWRYAEAAFLGDQAFFLKSIGCVNSSEMKEKLILSHREMQTDTTFYKNVNEISQRWFSLPPSELSTNQKARLIPYVFHSIRTSIPQLARCFGLPRKTVADYLGQKYESEQ